MIVSILPIIFPFSIALILAYLWRVTTKEPFNHWAACLLVFALSFFFYVIAIIGFCAYLFLKYVVFNKEKKEDEEKLE